MRFSHTVTAGTVAAAMLAGSAAAQKPDAPVVSSDTTFKTGVGTVHIHTETHGGPKGVLATFKAIGDSIANRGVLGLSLRTTGSKRDTLGLFVESVVANGPAEQAGIIEGDRIAAINGTDLRVSSSDLGDSYLSNVSLHRLRRQTSALRAGTKVQLRVYRDGRERTVTVTAGKASAVFKNGPMEFHLGEVPSVDLPDVAAMIPDVDALRFKVQGQIDAAQAQAEEGAQQIEDARNMIGELQMGGGGDDDADDDADDGDRATVQVLPEGHFMADVPSLPQARGRNVQFHAMTSAPGATFQVMPLKASVIRPGHAIMLKHLIRPETLAPDTSGVLAF